MKVSPVLLVPASCLVPLSLSAVIEIDNFSSATNYRFETSDNPDQFFLSSFDLSGIGQDSSGRWATLIGPNTILSANHYKPSGTLTFYPGNDLSATPWETSLTTDTLRINDENGNGTDLWIGRVDAVAPANIAVLPFANQLISESSNPFLSNDVFLTGLSTERTVAVPGDQAYGTNKVSGYIEDFSDWAGTDLGTVDALEMDYNSGETSSEAFLQVGDSGAPLLYSSETGIVTVLGINSFIGESEVGDPALDASFVNYIGNESDTIQTQIDAWAAVPEPGMAALPAGTAAVLLLLWQRRRLR
ncbi:MAG: hypothetical protein GVY10_11655 [Verrucomicrobia bacterium]|jgi:hypothetical protein|nr:hypothetical protein [Verrucomicrobiota bacterium]